MSYPKIKEIKVLQDYQIRTLFLNGDVRIYDCKPLLEKDTFKPLKNEIFFRNVKVDSGGYGIIWDDDIDLAESEIWINGRIESSSVAESGIRYGEKP